MSKTPEVVFASVADESAPKRRKKKVKVRGYVSKAESKIGRMMWFTGGLVTGAVLTLVSIVAVLGVSPQSPLATATQVPQAQSSDGPDVGRRLEIAGDVNEAREFLTSRLNPVTISTPEEQRVVWDVENPRLEDTWTWCEFSLSFRESARVKQCFRVNPTDLDYRTTMSPIRFYGERKYILSMECATGDCVFVRTFEQDVNGDGTVRETTANQERLTWYYDMQTDAQRSATAARQLLLLLGSERSPF